MPESPLTAVLDVAFPPRCVGCGAGTADRQRRDFCLGCELDLDVFREEVCYRCSMPLSEPSDSHAADCPACREERWAFERVLALGPYGGLLRRLVLEGKRRTGQPAAEAFGRLMAMICRTRLGVGRLSSGVVVVPIPQHWTRRLARRADGVGAMAAALADEAGLPCERALCRTRATPRQTEIAPSDRAANVRGALKARPNGRVAGCQVLLVDDVFTTGATCQAAAKALRAAGAERVVAVVAARRLGSL